MHLRVMLKRGWHHCFQGSESWERTIKCSGEGNGGTGRHIYGWVWLRSMAGKSGWVQTPAQPPSSCVTLSTSHSLWRPGVFHLYRREAEARSMCYIVASSWHLTQRQSSVRDVSWARTTVSTCRGRDGQGRGWGQFGRDAGSPLEEKQLFKNHC